MTEQQVTPGKLGSYQLLERLGEGGMGVVYLARDASGGQVAVKVLRPTVAEDPTARQRLAREVQTTRRVRSPFVAEIIDADISAERPYIVTRYVPGRTLDEVVSKEGALSGPALARVASGLAEALSAVHAAGVVHRDLKPSNVMMLDGAPVVIDFGIAQGPDATRLTMTGMFMGTPGYLAPEVIEGSPSSEASDVHAWGATVAFAATGRSPYGTGSYTSIFYRIVNGMPDLSGAPDPLLPLLTAALASKPGRRPSAAQLSGRLAALDPAAFIPSPGAATAPGPAVTGAGPLGGMVTAADGHAARPAGPPVPAATSPGAAGPGTRPLPAGGATDLASLLPPVRYGPGAPPPDAPAAPRAPAAPASSRARWQWALVFGSVVIAASVSVILPVAGTLVALILIAELRALGHTQRRASLRRAARGARASDGVLAVVSFPVYLVRAVFALVMLAPFALAAAVAAAAVCYSVHPHDWPRAVAYAAGAAVAFYGLGPGSGTSRRQLGRVFSAVSGTAVTQTVALVGVSALAVAAFTAALTWPSFYWPLHLPPRVPLNVPLHVHRWLTVLGAHRAGAARAAGPVTFVQRVRLLSQALLSRLGL